MDSEIKMTMEQARKQMEDYVKGYPDFPYVY